MKLCVLMPAYNEEKYITSAIASIIAARGPLEIEIIIVDDGSTDNTANVVRDIAKSTAGITLICTQNRGVSHARNTLLEALPSDCDLVTFLDADDAFEAGYLEKTCQKLADTPALDLIYSQLCLIDSEAQDMSKEPRTSSLICRTISMSIGIYRPALLAKTGKFDPNYQQAEDMDYLFRLFELGPTAALTENIAVLYRQHGGNITKDIMTMRRGFSRAILGHIRRRKADSNLASVDGIFSITQLGKALGNRRSA